MAETPSDPPGWPFNESLPEIPPPAPPPGPSYEPPPVYEPPSAYETPTLHQPPAAHQPPPPGSQPPPPPGAQPPPPSPGARMPPPPPPVRRKKKSPWRIVFIVLAVLAIPVGACGVWLVSITKPPVDESNRFLAVVDQGDYEAAAAMTSCGISAINLEEIFFGQDISYDLKSSNVTNGTSATVSGSLNVPAASYRQITLSLVKFGDTWSVCTFFVS